MSRRDLNRYGLRVVAVLGENPIYDTGADMRLIRIVVSLALVAPALPAQSTTIPAWPVESGARVRVLSPVLGDDKRVGVAGAATRDSLSFRGEKAPAYTSISATDIRQLDVSQGTHTRRLNGALIGFLVGAAAGAGIGAATHKDPDCANFGCVFAPLDTRGSDAFFGGVAGAALGTIAGVLIGGRKVDTWVPVAVPVR